MAVVSLSYTSGTTGKPKGVVYHSRGAHLLAIDNILAQKCRGIRFIFGRCRCFIATAAFLDHHLIGRDSCLSEKVNAANIYDSIVKHGVTNLCGAPIVMGMIANVEDQTNASFQTRSRSLIRGSAPAPGDCKMEEMGFQVTRLRADRNLWTFGGQYLAGRME